MVTLPTPFLETTLQGAAEHGVDSHPLPGNKGLLLFPPGLEASERAALVQELIKEWQVSLAPPASPATPPENPTSADHGSIDCQVSVEERAQLFKFLKG